LYLDGRPLINEPLAQRKEWLKDAIKNGETAYRVSEIVEDGESLFEAAKEHELEGIMAKRKDGKYFPGKRNDLWQKIKVRQGCDCIILGYTKGNGERGITFGALQIAEKKGEELHYRGKVGTGFDDDTIKEILSALKKLKEIKKPALKGGKVVDEKITTWVEPVTIAEINYSKFTPDEMFREPVFVRLRPDM
jgi:bifunctional non-homologous end joining protein LigD